MAKRVLLVDHLTPHNSNTNKIETTNWQLCVVCQEEKKDPLIRPDGRALQSGYESLAYQIAAFFLFGCDAF